MESSEGQTGIPTTKPEIGEINKTQLAPFLGGLFSAGGMMTLKVETGVKRNILKSTGEERLYPYTRVIPIITYSDNRSNKIERLKKIFGGKTVPHSSRNSRRWYLKDYKAVNLAALMQDFLPSRSQATEAFQEWAETKDNQVRMAIAHQLNESTQGKSVTVPKEIYKDLIENPLFLAGVFESRGLIHSRQGENKGIFIVINSENQGLLEAITDKYGGGITDVTEISRTLTIGREATGEVFKIITPYLLSPLLEYQKEAA